METADQLHNRLMYEHFAWFDKNVALPETESAPVLPHRDPFFKDSNGKYCAFKHDVWKYYNNELIGTKRILENVSWQEALLENDIITQERYNQHKANDTLTYPFKL